MSDKKRATLKGVRLEAIEFTIGVILLIGFFTPWGVSPAGNIYGFNFPSARVSFLGAWLVIVSALLNYRMYSSETLDKMKPFIDAGLGTLGGIFCAAGALFVLTDMSPVISPGWGIYLEIVVAFLAIFAAVKPYLDM